MENFIHNISDINNLWAFFTGLAGFTGILLAVAKYIIKKVNKIVDATVKTPILEEVHKNSEEYKEELNKHIIQDYKTYLVDFMAEAEKGKQIEKNQMKNAYEMKEEYNLRGGDSYVDEKWDELEEKGIIKDLRKKERRVI